MTLDTVFLDRDGTINIRARESEYILSTCDMKLAPQAARAIHVLNAADVRVIVLTNQRCVARGLISRPELDAMHSHLRQLLAAEDAFIDALYVCPHNLGECGCRKPLPGLFQRATDHDLTIDLANSVMIGDSEVDVAAAIAAGVRPVRLGKRTLITDADLIAPDLYSAVHAVLRQAAVTDSES